MEKICLTDLEVEKIIRDYFFRVTDIVDLSVRIGPSISIKYSKIYKGVTKSVIHFLTIEEYISLIHLVLTGLGRNVDFITEQRFYDNENNPYSIFTIYENTLKRTRIN